MNIKNVSLLTSSLIAATSCVGQSTEPEAKKTAKSPNIVYIFADDMGYGDVSCNNTGSKINTKHIDSIAKEGMRFTDAHTSSSVCTPSRYSVLTGRYCWRSRMKVFVLGGYSEHLIEDDRLTVGKFLQQNDYNTGCVGKWHLGWDWGLKDGVTAHFKDKINPRDDINKIDFSKPITFGPTHFGFDYFWGFSGSLDMPPYVWVENDKPTMVPTRNVKQNGGKGYWRAGSISDDFSHQEALPTITKKAVDFIKNQSTDKPFFLYMPLPAPHTPILPSKKFAGTSEVGIYGDFVLMVDDVVGQVKQAIKDRGFEENTIFIFTTDNGTSPACGIGDLLKKGHKPVGEFRGHKADIFDGGHRVPYVIKWPKLIKPNSVCNDTVCLTDLLATCADLLNKKLPDNAAEDSLSNLPCWKGKTLDLSKRQAVVHHSINGSFAIRKGKWKLNACPGSGGWSHPKPPKSYNGELPKLQLYDMEKDPGEKNNLVGQHENIVRELLTLLAKYVDDGRSTVGKKQPLQGEVKIPRLVK